LRGSTITSAAAACAARCCTTSPCRSQPERWSLPTGPSGSGKTTLLTLIGALRHGEGGSLQVLGHELIGCSDRQLSEVRRDQWLRLSGPTICTAA
jgi:energy-coupling factor transporter ATP-binding protein EcfA2